MPADFTCAECGRHMFLAEDAPPATGLCTACTWCPGWFRVPDIRAVLAPDHDGRELIEHAPPDCPPPLAMEL